MKHLLLPVLFFLALVGHSVAAQSRWQTYSPPDATFSVELPTNLQKVMSFEGEHGASLEPDQEIKFADCYAAIETTPSESRFGIIVIKAEEAGKAKMSRAEFITALSYTFLADDDETQYLSKPLPVHTNGLFGQEYWYASDRKNDFSVFIRGRILDADARIFVLVFVGRDQKDLTSTDANRFFNSFRVSMPGESRNAQGIQLARKVYEYSGDPRWEEESARLDYALVELSKDSEAKLHIVGYGLPGTTRRRVMRALSYAEARGVVDLDRIKPVIGGHRPDQSIELWIVPDGASPPVPSPQASPEDADGLARKFDEFFLSGEWFNYQKEPVLVDGFGEALKADPSSRGYIVVHRGRGIRCEYCYFWGQELKFANDLRQYLFKTQQISSERIKIVDRGYKAGRMELWIVPRGARPPKTGK